MITDARPRVAVLDDYQNAALNCADWRAVQQQAEVVVFDDHVADDDLLVERLQGFDAVAVMRERTPLRRPILARLPRLKLICSTGRSNASIDLAAAEELGIEVRTTGESGQGALELTWALILAAVRRLASEFRNFRSGGWQTTIGSDLSGATLGVVGLGRIGGPAARIGAAFGMNVIAWSPHLTADRAAEYGARLVGKDELFATSDVVTVQLVLSAATRGIIGLHELQLMPRHAYLVNTSRGPLVDETALIKVLTDGGIAGAALDVFDVEPLPADHPLRGLDNVIATSHIGFVTENSYRTFFADTVTNLEQWLSRRPSDPA